MLQDVQHVSHAIPFARVGCLTAIEIDHSAGQQSSVHHGLGQKTQGLGIPFISQHHPQPFLVMDQASLASHAEKVPAIHTFHIVQCGLVPLIPDQVLVEVAEEQLHV